MKIKTKVAFAGVPAGTTGIAELVKSGKNPEYKVTWDLPRPRPLVDWFDHGEFCRYLEVI